MTGVQGALDGEAVTVSRRTTRPSVNEAEIAARVLRALQSADLKATEALRVVRHLSMGRSTFFATWNRLELERDPIDDDEDDCQ